MRNVQQAARRKTAGTGTGRRFRAPASIATALVVAALVHVAVAPVARGDDAADEARRLARVNAQLAQRLELAQGGGFYLVLDVEAKRLDLMLEGVVLHGYTVARMELGRSRIAFIQRSRGREWADRAWTGGRLEPSRPEERIEIEVKSADDSEETAIPPTPEMRYPAPERFLVEYEGGFSLEIVADGPAAGVNSVGLLGSISRRFADAAAAVGPRSGRLPRLRLVLPAEDAAAFYRSLPPDTGLLVAFEPIAPQS